MTADSPHCKICGTNTSFFGSSLLLKKHPVRYFQCGHCGFIQTEEPYWLSEVYVDAINLTDVGLVKRNLNTAERVATLTALLFDAKGSFIDYGAGYGLFVRLMRDKGLDYYWYDRYSQNLFAKLFEADIASDQFYTLLSAFEVFEHLVDPWHELQQMARLSKNIVFTTVLLPTPAPQLDQWWYYGLEHGQHVAFYTQKALRLLGQRLGLHFYSNGRNFHLFSEKKIHPLRFRFAVSTRTSQWWGRIARRPSLTQKDYEYTKRIGTTNTIADTPAKPNTTLDAELG